MSTSPQTANPIAERLSRGTWPSERAARWLGLGAFGLGCAIGGAALLLASRMGQPVFYPALSALFVLTSLALALYGPICMLVAVLLTASQAGGEDFALLRLTGLRGAEIVDGFKAGIARRMRFVEPFGLWLPSGIALVAWGLVALVVSSSPITVLIAVVGVVLIVSALAGLGRSIGGLGVLIGLRWPGALVRGWAAAGAVLIAMGVGAPAAWVLLTASPPVSSAVCLPVGVLIVLSMRRLDRAVSRRVGAFIDGHIGPIKPAEEP